jgi:hypothetical protein
MNVAGDERGLVGKLLVLWLVALAVVVVVLWDVGSIAIAHLRTANLAQDAAFAGAERFDETGRRPQAARAARAAITAADDDARLDDIEISPRGDVTVVVTDRAATLLAGRIGFLAEFATITSSDTSGG